MMTLDQILKKKIAFVHVHDTQAVVKAHALSDCDLLRYKNKAVSIGIVITVKNTREFADLILDKLKAETGAISTKNEVSSWPTSKTRVIVIRQDKVARPGGKNKVALRLVAMSAHLGCLSVIGGESTQLDLVLPEKQDKQEIVSVTVNPNTQEALSKAIADAPVEEAVTSKPITQSRSIDEGHEKMKSMRLGLNPSYRMKHAHILNERAIALYEAASRAGTPFNHPYHALNTVHRMFKMSMDIL